MDNKDWIDLIKDFVFFLGAYHVIKFLWRRDFLTKTQEIANNLEIREAIEDKLQEHVLKETKNGIKDIGIRLVFWKNYPCHFENDAFKHFLRVDRDEPNTIPSGWIDKTGINFQEHLWHGEQSVYVDNSGIFFFSAQDEVHEGFQELKNKCLVMHLPFANIVNYDFREKIEYEPVFYIKHRYNKYRKLYDNIFVVREKYGDPYYRKELSREKKLPKYNAFIYSLMKLKINIKKKLARSEQ